ncbi:MAG: amylo-alpha-1,6-glucosidase, partial [Promicromonosporaceae bacterium]|nr:amylo-alpha-1,6-glucosidase [Promicromonosporaceae bacterium]
MNQPEMPLQPLLHDLQVTLMAPSQVWTTADGQVRPGGLPGVYHGDVRVLNQALLLVDGLEPETIGQRPLAPGVSETTYALRMIDTGTADPTTMLVRRREVLPGQVTEVLTLTCATEAPVSGELTVTLSSDLARTETIKSGLSAPLVSPRPLPTGVRFEREGSVVDLVSPDLVASIDGQAATFRADVTVRPGEALTVSWTAHSRIAAVVGAPADPAPEWRTPSITATDRRIGPLLRRSLDDLASLRMTAGLAPDETFLAAGAPWFYTLFGRDSLIAARFMLPLGTDLARGTLRTLAACQGTKIDP